MEELRGRSRARAAREPSPTDVQDYRYRGRARHEHGEELERPAYISCSIDKHGAWAPVTAVSFERLDPVLLEARDGASLRAANADG